MNKDIFLNELGQRLHGLPEEEVRKAMDYYSEMIDDAVEDGENEEEVIERLGNIDGIICEIIDKTPIRALVKANFKRQKQAAQKQNASGMRIFIIVLLILGSPIWISLLAAVFSVVVSLYLSLWAVIASVLITAAALLIAVPVSLIMAIVFIFIDPLKALMAFGIAMTFAGAGILVGEAGVICVKLTSKFTVFIMRKIKNVFIKKGSERDE